MTQRKPQGMTFETWVEQQIRRAADEGAFEGLSLTGKPDAKVSSLHTATGDPPDSR